MNKNAVAIIPAYNEEKSIQEVVKRVKKFCPAVVIDDGSTDETAKLAKKAGASVFKHSINMGKGLTIKTALIHIKNKHIIIIDADLQFLPEEIPNFLNKLKNYDYITGYRNFKTLPLRHRLGNFVWRTTFNFLFKTKLKDTNCGFVAINKNALKKINFSGGYIIENAMLIDAIKNNLKILQIPVTVNYRFVSKIPRGVRMVLGNLLFIITQGLKYRCLK